MKWDKCFQGYEASHDPGGFTQGRAVNAFQVGPNGTGVMLPARPSGSKGANALLSCCPEVHRPEEPESRTRPGRVRPSEDASSPSSPLGGRGSVGVQQAIGPWPEDS